MEKIQEKAQIVTELLDEMKQSKTFNHLFVMTVFYGRTKELKEKMGSVDGYYSAPVQYEVNLSHDCISNNIIKNVDLEKTHIENNCLWIYDNRGFQQVCDIEHMTKLYALNDEMLKDFTK